MSRRKKKPQRVDYLGGITAQLNRIDWRQLTRSALGKWKLLPKLHQRALIILTPCVLLLILLPPPKPTSERSTVSRASSSRVEVKVNTRTLSEQQGTEQKSTEQDSLSAKAWTEYQVKSGDTLAQVFRRNGLAMADLNALVKVEGADKPLSHIQQGQLVRFKLTESGELDILQLEKRNQSVMFFRLSDGGFGRSK